MAIGRGLISFTLGIVFDIICYIIASVPNYVLPFIVLPYKRGFFCNDVSIRYPYKDDTVTFLEVTAFGLFIPIIFFIVMEILQHFYSKCSNNSSSNDHHVTNSYHVTSTCSIPRPIVCCYKVVGIYLFGNAVAQSMMMVAKYSAGRLRPHFIDVCRPNQTTFNCTDGSIAYVEDFVCTGDDAIRLLDARMSFPSGHASESAFCVVFIVFYLQARFPWKRIQLLKHLIQALFIYVAVYICLSRVSDYKHHPTDVLAGALLGCIIAISTGFQMLNMFRPSDQTVFRPNNIEIGGQREYCNDGGGGRIPKINSSAYSLVSPSRSAPTTPVRSPRPTNYGSTSSMKTLDELS